ncbi:hypothetical protein BDZ89DRAFT_1071653 [Hymenopellis radicata]|nr:hypothetical protein BDZ89DRAFT_1071653 [Hymenopellis radicata]
MARGMPLLSSPTPTAVASADVHIGHVQLRDLIVCPRERGVVAYVKQNALMEHNLNKPDSTARKLVDLPFTPNTLTSMMIPGTDDTILAAGGQEAEMHLSCYSPSSSSSRHRRAQLRWHYDDHIRGSINNSLLLTSLSMTSSNQSSVEPRVAVSNNDGTVRFFDIPVRNEHFTSLPESGCIHLGVPINHSSVSPDGRTLLSVGDTSKVFLHRLTGGSHINITPIATLSLPPPDVSFLPYASTALVASFSAAFSSDGTKYAVASQEGTVAVWDVRSTKPLKTFQTDKSRVALGNGGATGWLSDDPWEWTRGSCKAPGWSVRNVKFSQGGRNGMGKEIMTFTESLLHIIDARTFETEEIVQAPHAPTPPPPPPHSPARRPHPTLSQSGIATPPTMSYDDPPTPSSYMFMALEDTFRIPSMSPSSRRRRSRRSTPTGDTDDDLVVIPSMGDRDVENDVQLDCLSSHTPSRSSSPSPSVHIGARLTSFSPPARRISVVREEELAGDSAGTDGLDIAGVCFDPTGGYVYVATTESVAEWSISGAEKRWWIEDGWA